MIRIMAAGANSLYPFLFVGCWNKVGTKRDAVVAAIAADDISTLFLGGDNIYPEKVDGRKVYNASMLASEAEKLSAKKVYGAFGNHNLNFYAEEKALWHFDGDYYRAEFREADVIVLDTNKVTDAAALPIMLDWLAEQVHALQTEGKPYYIIQHEPYVSLKKKKKQVLVNGHMMLDILITYPPVAVLCADTHNYQVGTVTYNGKDIKQIVVGTGGATHDPIESDGRTFSVGGQLQYTLTEHIEGFGYLRVTGLDMYEFVRVVGWTGGKMLTRRRRFRRNKTCRL